MSNPRNGIQLNVQNVVKQFNQNTVLKGVNIDIQPGEFVVIVGRSGCGKSTLLRLVGGLDLPSDGLVLIDGEEQKKVHPGTRILFQDDRLLPWKKVLENVRIGLPKSQYNRALTALEQVGLADRANEWPRVLSGGQRQRVALARALAGEPRLLLFDEPLGALDALTRIEMQNLIEDIWLKQKFTALLVTHDVSEAVLLADRVILIDNGNVTLDLKIELARPRIRDSGFAYYEQQILDRILDRRTIKPLTNSFSI